MMPVLNWTNLVAGAVLGALVGYFTGHWLGYNAGQSAAQVKNLQADFDQVKERQENDAKVDKMDDAGLCRLLGGSLQPDGTCQ